MPKFFLLQKKQSSGPKKERLMSRLSSSAVLSKSQSIMSVTPLLEIEDDNSLLAPEILPGLAKSTSTDPDDDCAVPTEVTILGPHDANDGGKDQTEADEKLKEQSQIEVREYRQQLHDTQNLVDHLTMDLNRARLQVAELIKHNTRLLEELKAVAGKDSASLDEYRMLRQELMILKGCLFFGALFIFWGGRADIIAILAFVWILAEIFVH